MNLEQVLEKIQLRPDFEVSTDSISAPIRYIHRQIGEADVYFVANQQRTSKELICNFRVKGKIPEFWNPISGERTRAMVYQTNEETISVPVQLEAYGSVFVVFRSDLLLNRRLFVLFIKMGSV